MTKKGTKNNHLALRGSGKGAVEVGVGGGKGARSGRSEYIIYNRKDAKRMISITKESVLCCRFNNRRDPSHERHK